ncbi:MAG: hypothetical protein R3C44_03315 [Chloroflexota bacterium]
MRVATNGYIRESNPGDDKGRQEEYGRSQANYLEIKDDQRRTD